MKLKSIAILAALAEGRGGAAAEERVAWVRAQFATESVAPKVQAYLERVARGELPRR